MSSFRKIATVIAGAAIAVGCGSAAAFADAQDPSETIEVPQEGVEAVPAKPAEPGKGEKPGKGESVHIVKGEDGGIRIIKGDGSEIPEDAEPAKPAEPAE